MFVHVEIAEKNILKQSVKTSGIILSNHVNRTIKMEKFNKKKIVRFAI